MRFAFIGSPPRGAAARSASLVAEPGDPDEALVIRADGEVRPDQHLGDLDRRLGEQRGGRRVGLHQRIAMFRNECREICHVGGDIAEAEQRLDGGPRSGSLDLCAALPRRSRRTGVGLGVCPSELERASLERRGLPAAAPPALGPGTTGAGRADTSPRAEAASAEAPRGLRPRRPSRLSGLARKLGEELRRRRADRA